MILTALETDEDWATVQAVIQKIKEENGIDDNDEVDVDDDIIDIEELSKIMGRITAQTCPDCERDFPFKSDYCPYCGRKVVKKKAEGKLLEDYSDETMRICSKCGNFVHGDYIYCDNCGEIIK